MTILLVRFGDGTQHSCFWWCGCKGCWDTSSQFPGDTDSSDAAAGTAAAGAAAAGGKNQRSQQRVEILKIAEPCPLIDPSQVVVTQGEIFVADPVLTPIGI